MRTGGRRAVAGLMIASVALVGCTTMKDLAPAFDANKTNTEELAANVASLTQQIRPLVESAWDSEIESRRTAVLLELQKLGLPYKANLTGLTGAQLDTDFADVNMPWKADYDRLGTALSAAANDPPESDRLQSTHPVLSAILVLKVSPDQAAAHARKLYESRGQIASVRTELTRDYPFVARAVEGKDKSLKELGDFTSVIDKQLRLAKGHADLFSFASKSNLNVERAFGTLLADQGLQGQVLGLIKDPKWKDSASEGLTILTGMLSKDAASKAAGNK